MFKNYSLLAYLMIASAVIGFSAPSVAEQPLGQFGVWEAFTENAGKSRICYMATEATKARGNYKKRGKTYIMVTHRPANDLARIQVDYGGQVQPSFIGRKIADIGHPLLIRRAGVEVLLQ